LRSLALWFSAPQFLFAKNVLDSQIDCSRPTWFT
jgi:hypothetical protein